MEEVWVQALKKQGWVLTLSAVFLCLCVCLCVHVCACVHVNVEIGSSGTSFCLRQGVHWPGTLPSGWAGLAGSGLWRFASLHLASTHHHA